MSARKLGWIYEHQIFRPVLAGKRAHYIPAIARRTGMPKANNHAYRRARTRRRIAVGGSSEAIAAVAKEKKSEPGRTCSRKGLSHSSAGEWLAPKTGNQSSLQIG